MQHTKNDAQAVVNFDYEALSPEKRASVQTWTVEIKERLQHTARTIWEIGERLVEVRSQLEYRQFSSWLKLEFGWSQRTAYNFINVYEAFPELANFAKIDISISALYVLAAPSTPPEIRISFLNRAIAGEQITYKVIKSAIKEAKLQLGDNDKLTTAIQNSHPDYPHSNAPDPQSENTVQVKPQVPSIAYPSKDSSEATVKISEEAFGSQPKPAFSTTTATTSEIRPGWNLIKREFLLFWGDTASPRFIERLPEEAFILAIPSSQWHHNWLLSKSRSFIILYQPDLNEELMARLLSEFSQQGEKAVILPWLPSWKTIALALKLNIKVYAGESDLKKCEKVLSNLGSNVARMNL